MKVSSTRRFEKDLAAYRNNDLNERVYQALLRLQELTIEEAIRYNKFFKRLSLSNYYRLRVGDFRIGLELEEDGTMVALTIGSRGDIYKRFPPR
jgi:mRNA interferase RelE/StbE